MSRSWSRTLFRGGLYVSILALVAGCASGVLSPRTVTISSISGAIYTTTFTGAIVNANIFDSKDYVYLNGGPPPNAPCTAAGLPDGWYYFQVTDPAGSVLLSTDDISDRQVRVAGGVIVQVVNHSTGTGKCGGISAKLMPYWDTPIPGGVYKVWLTPQGDYVSPGPETCTSSSPPRARLTTSLSAGKSLSPW